MPPLRINGLIFGSRIIEWHEQITFTDKKNDLVCNVEFYKDPGLFSRSKHPSDHFEGTIAKLSDKDRVLCQVNGRWTEKIEFDGKKYWDIRFVEPVLHIHTLDPLPSDQRFREDLIYLARKDLALAQEHKVRLEVIQRRDRKLRNDYKENQKNHGNK